ncbi:EAL domain-containing protein [Piscinibacter koreensis]|uniref:EAL domain-containing protein n=1 Tax=Piscinibacter koreensis TaxID=2742824 RepID=A0A7Y6NLR0_9BURK|nr:EAL domain-containing protein [Schlegelella koreensis]NUZ05521.1 EAL domain-containing protein [Schlegelella koreensis]
MSTSVVEERSLIRLVRCNAPAWGSAAYEVRGFALAGATRLRPTMKWLRESLPGDTAFVLINAPGGLLAEDVGEIAECAADAGIVDKLAVAVTEPGARSASLFEAFERHRVSVVLDRVGPQTRFGDLGRHPLQGIRLEPDFLCGCEGDPALASVLDGIVCVARNLGLVTIATGVPAPLAEHFLPEVGIDYVAVR